jgi:hypothetical protein
MFSTDHVVLKERKKMKKLFIVLTVCLVVFAGSANCYADQHEDTLKLLEVTGSLDIGAQMGTAIAQQMVSNLKNARPDIDPKAFTIIEEEISNIIDSEMKNTNGIVQDLIKIYSKYYSHQDIKDLLTFYQSDLGKKLISTMPNVMQESMVVGQNWGQSIIPKLQASIETRFKAEGIEIQ